ncbi:MAG: tRNA (guanosine(46)-N7)-methyltransferase TrmB [Bdellovibrionaceae bacterium]|nr:tRNA (guanosine(46)-N7)-methyltransferase TrmB [Pseudobdellovibrionaceae bacterium]
MSNVKLKATTDIPNPNKYIQLLEGSFSNYAFSEKRVIENKGVWRKNIFQVTENTPLDLEIGIGNGFHFAYYANKHSTRCLVGLEIKFKPLIQSIQRALKNNAKNMRVARYNACFVEDLFSNEEVNNVIIHHPDPWLKKKQHKHRLIQKNFLDKLFLLQKKQSFLEIKTDSLDYFEWIYKAVKKTKYSIVEISYDLHHSPYKEDNFTTYFETIFLKKSQAIYWLKAIKL